uniref:PH domain-containing protein n=1 Tax=Hyaloperonospora arabidopsidis (strain Emoy2) TaxID=559515 RepID=M4BA23_HYAAE
MESSIVEIEEKAATRPCSFRAVSLGDNNMNHLTTATTTTTTTTTATTTTTTLSSSSSSTSLDCDVIHHVQSPLVPQLPNNKNESQGTSCSRGLTSNVLAVASRVRSHDNVSAASVPMRRHNSSQNIKQIALERKRSAGSNTLSAAAMIRAVKAANAGGDDRTGFARIYFENKTFTSSTVFKLLGSTTVLEVRKSMAAKIKIRMQDFDKYAIVVVFPTDGAGSMSARTLKDEELILPLVERLNRARSVQQIAEGTETTGGGSSTRLKAKHVARPPVKFVLKDVQGSQLDIGESVASPKCQQSDTQSINFPVLLGKKASSTDTNLWRKRWFIIKGDQLLYFLAKAKPEVRVAFSFQLKTPRRDYEQGRNGGLDSRAARPDWSMLRKPPLVRSRDLDYGRREYMCKSE